jgi:DNA-binding NarL/FixJ family response regulator
MMLEEQRLSHETVWKPVLDPADSSRALLGLEALLVGELQVTAFCRGEANFVISLSHREPRSPTQLKLRERQIIESLLAGCSQKQMAYDLKLAATTISEAIRQILGKVGVARWEHLVAVGCALGVADRGQNCILRLDHANQLKLVLLVRPSVVSRLTPAERDVSLYVIEGWSNAQISRARSTSVRTIANQIASLFRKLNVRGRLELILRLLGDDSAS